MIDVERVNITLNHSPELETYLKINVSLATKTSAPGRLWSLIDFSNLAQNAILKKEYGWHKVK